jgi:hypothetical protein
MSVIKTAYITATFPDLPVPKATQDGRGQGSNIRVAAANAMKDLLKKPALRKRKISGAKMAIVFGEIRPVEESNEDQHSTD